MTTKKTNLSERVALLERYRLATIAHREAIYSIAYKMNGSPSFGEIPDRYVKEYERARINLLEIERQVEDIRFS